MNTFDTEFIRNAIVAGFAFMLADAIWHAHRRDKAKYLSLLKSVYLAGWKEYLRAFGIFVLTIVVAVEAVEHAPEILKFGWMQWFDESGANPALAQLNQARTHPSPNTLFSLMLATGYFILFLFAIPLVSCKEEKWFRKGHVRWLPICTMSLLFGLMHLLLGIPIIIGLVLAIPGFLYALRYRSVFLTSLQTNQDKHHAHEAALLASTVTHSLVNMIIVTILVSVVTANAIMR